MYSSEQYLDILNEILLEWDSFFERFLYALLTVYFLLAPYAFDDRDTFQNL